MTTREKILAAVAKNQPPLSPLPDLAAFKGDPENVVGRYLQLFGDIGGRAVRVENPEDLQAQLAGLFDLRKRVVTTLPELAGIGEFYSPAEGPHALQDVEIAVIKAHFAVAENGAVWLTEELMGHRILPYICQHLAVVVEAESILPTLHEAYEKIGAGEYGFGGFIGGPSKTADIEQSLVMGAHGPITMTVLVVG
jgi:L-lactate dehydrogenase complex protein LldG